MSHSALCHGILYPRPAPIEYNKATLQLISLRTMSQIARWVSDCYCRLLRISWNEPDSSVMIRVVSILILYLGISSSIQQQGHSPLVTLMSSHLQRSFVLDLYVHLSIKKNVHRNNSVHEIAHCHINCRVIGKIIIIIIIMVYLFWQQKKLD